MEDVPAPKMSITIYPEAEQYGKLLELSKATRIPLSVLIREGIDLLLEKRKEETA